MATGYLASVFVLLHDLARAETLLHSTLDPGTAAQTMAQRIAWCASAEISLARGHPAQALEVTDRLMMSGAQESEGRGSLRVMKLRGEALAALQRPRESSAILTRAQTIATAQGARPLLWQINVVLGNLYRVQGRNTEAEQVFTSARTLIGELAASISDENLREDFLRQALSRFPTSPSSSPARAAKHTPGGLTERECDVALLIAQGKSNQEIANTLVVTKRTVETHVGNIMFKLGCTSRTQIAVWAVETGLAEKTR